MLVNNANITQKNYRKLSMQISPDLVSFCCTDTLSGLVLWIKEIPMLIDLGGSTETRFHELFKSESVLNDPYDEVVVLHNNPYNSFVPEPLFDEDFLGSYLQFSTKVFETDYFAFDQLKTYEMNNVFVPYANLNRLLQDKFGSFKFNHSATSLVSGLLEKSKNIDERQVYAHIQQTRFELVVVQNQKLLLYNAFDYRTKEDFIYYLLFTAEQLSLNPEQFKLHLFGQINKEDEIFQMAYKYVRHVDLLEVSHQQIRNSQSETENRKHFVLLQS